MMPDTARETESSRGRFRPWILAPIVVVTGAALLIAPPPLWMLPRYLLLGAVVGVLFAPRWLPLSLAGLVVMLVGLDAAGDSVRRLAFDGALSWKDIWSLQAAATAWSMAIVVVVGAATVNGLLRRKALQEE